MPKISELPAATGLTDDDLLVIVQSNTTKKIDSELVTGFVNAKHYGATGNGSTDDTAALQEAINAAANGSRRLYIPAGHYKYVRLYCHYDAANNSTFPNTPTSERGRLIIYGDGGGDLQNWSGSPRNPEGTILESTATTGTCFAVGDGSQENVRNVLIEHIGFWGATSGQIVRWNRVSGWSKMAHCFIGNGGTGHGLVLNDVWMCGFEHIEAYGNGTTTGTGVWWYNTTTAGGHVRFENVTGQNWLVGVCIGGQTWGLTDSPQQGEATRAGVFTNVQGRNCGTGLKLGYGCQDNVFLAAWTEQNVTTGIRVFMGASNNEFHNAYTYEPTATEANVCLGDVTGDVNETAHPRNRLYGITCDGVNVAGIKVFLGTEDYNTEIWYPRFSRADASPLPTPTAILLPRDGSPLTPQAQHGLTIVRPTYINMTREIADDGGTDRSNLVDLLVTEDTLGRWSFAAPVRFRGNLELVDGVTAPSTVAGAAVIYVDESDGDLKVRFGDGTIKTLTTDT